MTNSYLMTPIGHVECERTEPIDDNWGSVESIIRIDTRQFTDAVLAGLTDFSHIDVVYCFDQVDESKIHLGSRHPRNRTDWPLVGIFAQRAKARPNRIGVTTCELITIDNLNVHVRGLDAIDNTPVLDIKPHVREFQARSPVTQPDWISELMTNYW